MGAVFGKEKPLKEVIRENQRMLKKAIRELEKVVRDMQGEEKKLISSIQKAAKQGQMSSVRVMAKDLNRTRNYITRFIEMKTHLNGVSLKMQTVKSQDAMAQAMKGVTKALVAMNKSVSAPMLQKIMADFMRENEKSELNQEMMGDALDDALAEDGSEEMEDKIVSQVLDELGISQSESVPDAPANVFTATQQKTKETEKEPVADSTLSDLEQRLNNLNK